MSMCVFVLLLVYFQGRIPEVELLEQKRSKYIRSHYLLNYVSLYILQMLAFCVWYLL